MQTLARVVIAAVVVIAILIVAAFVWYNYTGWQAFSFQTGDSASWALPAQADISLLRFKGCTFTVTRGDGVTRTYDVTPVLNGMAAAYAGGTSNPPLLKLTRPLNAFSFVIPGFNDSRTVSDPTVPPWCSSPPVTCASDSDCPGAARGSCSIQQTGSCSPACPAGQVCVQGTCLPRGACSGCKGAAAVTLTGSWRML